MRAFIKGLLDAKDKYFDSIYGEKQLFLLSLATHPDYHRRGIGAALCKWGMAKAKAEG